jgi:hypothetical protein
MRTCPTHHFACDCRERDIRNLISEMMRDHANPSCAKYNGCDRRKCAWCEEAARIINHGHPDKDT